jgi:anion transporter
MIKDKKVMGVIIVALTALIIGLFQPFRGLAPLGHYVVAIVIMTLGLWIFRPAGLPLVAGSAFLIGGCLAAGLRFNTVTSGFASPAVWILIPALYFGFVLAKTGLGKRLAYLILKSFQPGWITMALSWFIIGMILSALTPSITVRLSIVMPIAMGVIDACKQKYNSRGSAFITLVAFAMCIFPGTGWLTGSLHGPILTGFLPPELKSFAGFDSWFRMMSVPWFMVTVIYVGLMCVFMRPKEPIGISRDIFRKEYDSLGPVSKNEIITAIILIATLIMFTTEKIHGVPAAGSAMIALVLLLLLRIIGPNEIGIGVNWDVIIFFGAATGLSAIFGDAKVSAWIVPMLQPKMLSLAHDPLTFMLVMALGAMAIRFIDIPWDYTTAALTTVLLIPLFHDFGLHPLMVMFAYTVGANFFLLSYQQPWVVMADGMLQGRGWTARYVLMAGMCYIVAVIAAIMLSIPYWRMVGGIRL